EDRAELDLTETPRLIELTDVKAELHAHTSASDGSLELHELVAQAKRRAFHTIAVTDHSKSSVVAGGLDEKRLAEQREQIEALRETTKGIAILCGSEVDILSDGRLDFDDDTLATLDAVVASPHVALKQDPKAATKRLIHAIENPYVNILGHPTGRLINRRPGLSPDMAEVIAAAKHHRVALEINAHWMRLDLRDTHVRAAVEAGCLIAINCDVHGAPDFDNLRYGILTARRGWLPPEQCVNCWPAKRLRDWLASRRPK
ncbi:MAG: PHP domain-containing protein, partial [Phycisphaeraceae bacterium]|nr:PHP domain-containing protein [Phycisphaeraceae bacterium]